MAKKKKAAKKKPSSIPEINPKLIKPNPENVRQESEEEIESEESFLRLKESVYTYGVLVPLVVKPYNKPKSKFKYILIDGERRLRAALATNQRFIPVHILGETDVANQILYAFQIHMLRKEWSRPAQARALHKIVKDIKKEMKKASEKKLFPILQEKTGYNQNRLKDLLRVLRYVDKDEKILDELDNSKSNLKFSHLVQFEASFIEQLERHFPEIVSEYGIRKIREQLVRKVKRKIITATREPMEQLLPLFMQARESKQKRYLKKLIKEFLDKQEKTPGYVCRKFELEYPSNKEDLIKSVKQACGKMEELESILKNLNISQLRVYKKLGDRLKTQIVSLAKMMNSTKKKIIK